MADDILLLQGQFEAFAIHLIDLSVKRCKSKEVEIEPVALSEFTNYVSNAFVNLKEDDLTLEFRIRAEVALELFVDKMIQKAVPHEVNLFESTITPAVFRSIRSLLCPGFFPFC